MTTDQIEKVKKEGIRENLFSAICDKLWAAKNAIDAAKVEPKKDFVKQISIVKELIEDAEQLYEEWQKI